MATNCHGLVDGKEYPLKIGSSFQPGKTSDAFYTMRYDFKPATVDKNQGGRVSIGTKNDCTVTLPNHDSGVTIYKGGKKPCTKDCILIIDQETGEITLERISSNISLKKHRVDRTGDAAPKLHQMKPTGNKPTKANLTKPTVKNSPSPGPKQTFTQQPVAKQPRSQSPVTKQPLVVNQSVKQPANQAKSVPTMPGKTLVTSQMSMSSDSSSSSDSSDSDDSGDDVASLNETPTKPPQAPRETMTTKQLPTCEAMTARPSQLPPHETMATRPSQVPQHETIAARPSQVHQRETMATKADPYMSTLQSDLQLSDSNSDSD